MWARVTTRLIIAVAAIGSIVGVPVSVGASDDVAAVAVVVQGGTSADHRVVGTTEPADAGGDDGPGAAPIIGGLVILGAVFAMGLSAIRRQRAEGRRSKLPPIG